MSGLLSKPDAHCTEIRELGLPVEKSAETNTEMRKRIAVQAGKAKTNPTEKEKDSGRYRKGRFSFHGMRLAIENPKGSTRSGVGGDGKKWENKMHSHYGYIEGTEGSDSDPVDVFVGDEPHSEYVVVINQVDPKTQKFDEHKVMLGYTSAAKAKACYLKNYDKGWKGLGSATPMTMGQFRWWLEHQDTTKPIRDGFFAAPEERKPRVLFRQRMTVIQFKAAADKKDHPFTVAVDLDGTLAKHFETYDDDAIPDPRPGVRKWMRHFRDLGYRIIIFTVRGNDELVRGWLDKNDIPFDFINENPDQPEGASDKVLADVYIDDRGIDARASWKNIAKKVSQREKKAEEAQAYEIAKSPVHGNGVFAARDLKKGDSIGTAMNARGKDEFDREQLYQNRLGRNLNYGKPDQEPNVGLRADSKSTFELYALEDMAEGQEFLASSNYYQEYKALDMPDGRVLMNGTTPSALETEHALKPLPKEAGAKCPGCGAAFKKDEPGRGVDNCEVCEHFGPPRKEKFAWEKMAEVEKLLEDFTGDAELMGSRGRALLYGRPEPEDRDHDYTVFTDDPVEKEQKKQQLQKLIALGFTQHDRPGGFMTASGLGHDVSVHPVSKRQQILDAWALMEDGMPKEEAWALLDAQAQKSASGELYDQDRHVAQTPDSLGVATLKIDDEDIANEDDGLDSGTDLRGIGAGTSWA